MIITGKLDVKGRGAGIQPSNGNFPLDFAGLKIFFHRNGRV